MWRYAVPLAIFAVIAVFFYRGLSLRPNFVPSPLVGKPVPEFTLPGLKDPNANVTQDDLRGQVSLLNVWGTWCIECRYEHPFLIELAHEQGIPIYGLSLKDDRAMALEWLARLGDPYVESGFDEDGRVALDWGVTAAPETFLIGRDGTILHKHISPLTPQVWQRDFLPKIAKECGSLPCPPASGGDAR